MAGTDLTAGAVTNGVNTILNSSQKWIDGIQASDDSIALSVSSIESGFNGWFKTTLDKVTQGISTVSDASTKQADAMLRGTLPGAQPEGKKDEAVKFKEDTKNTGLFEKMSDKFGFGKSDKKDEGPDKENDKKRTKTSQTKIEDLKSLSVSNGLGFVALWWKLDEISNKLPDDNKKKKSNGLSGIFKGLLEGAAGIALLAVALIVFAGAMLVFNFVQWGPAMLGLVAFGIFTAGMVLIAKKLGKEVGTFGQFAIASILMSASLGVFAISLLIASNVFTGKETHIGPLTIGPISLVGALAALGTFAVFITGVAIISRLMSKEDKDFVGFAKASFILAGALAAFAVGLYIAAAIMSGDKIGPLPPIKTQGILPALALFGVFILGFAVISRIANSENSSFMEFAKSSILMSASLVTFAVALYITSAIISSQDIKDGNGKTIMSGFKMNAAISGLVLFAAFITGMIALSALANNFAPNFGEFAVTTLLLIGSLVLFAGALAIMSAVLGGGGTNEFKVGNHSFSIPKSNLLLAIAGVALFVGFIFSMAVLGTVAEASIPAIGSLAVASVVMCVALAAFGVALTLTILALSGGEATLMGKKWNFGKAGTLARIGQAIAGLALMVGFMAAFAGIGVAAGIALPFALITSAAFLAITAAMIPMSMALGLATLIGTKGGKMEFAGKVYSIPAVSVDNLKLGLGMMTTFIKEFAKIPFLTAQKASKEAKVLNPIIDTMDNLIKVLKHASSMKTIPDIPVSIFDPVLHVIDALEYTAKTMDKKSAKTLKLITESMIPIINAMDKLLDVVDKAANLKGKQGQTIQQYLQQGNSNLLLIADGFAPIFVQVAEKIKGTSKSAVEAMSAIPSLVDALSGMIDVIKKANGAKVSEISSGITSLGMVVQFIGKVYNAVAAISGAQGLGGAIAGFFGGKPADKIKAAHEILIGKDGGPGINQIINDISTIAQTTAGLSISNTSNIEKIKGFDAAFVKGAENFGKGMRKVGDGIEKLVGKENSLESVTSSMVKLSQVKITDVFSPIVDNAKTIHTVAEDLASMSKSLKSINKGPSLSERMSAAFSGAADTGKNAIAKLSGKGTPELNADKTNSMVTVAPGQELSTIASIIATWNENGVPVVGPVKQDKTKPINAYRI